MTLHRADRQPEGIRDLRVTELVVERQLHHAPRHRLEAFESEHAEWEGFKRRLVLPGVASHLKAFDSVMHGPAEVPRRLDSIAPSPTPSLV